MNAKKELDELKLKISEIENTSNYTLINDKFNTKIINIEIEIDEYKRQIEQLNSNLAEKDAQM